MAATTSFHKVLTPSNAQPIPIQPIEWWTDKNGQKWRRTSLGDVAAGSLILGLAKRHGQDLYWRGRSLKRALISAPLDMVLQGAWERMSRKSGPHRMIRVAGVANSADGTWWLALLPLGRYLVETRLDGGAELFRLLPVIKRPRGPQPPPPEADPQRVPPPGPWPRANGR